MENKMAIKIAIDTIFFQMSYSGITRVWETLFKNFAANKDNKNYEITILQRGNGNTYKFKPELNIEKKFKVLKINEFNYFTMNQDVDYLNHICKTEGFDVFISTYYTYCTVIPNILLIHDMIPEVFKFAPNHMWKQKNKAILNASSFITISKTTEKDLIKYYPHIKNGKDKCNGNYDIELIYNSIASNNNTNTNTNTNYDDSLLKSNNIKPKTYIFAMATNNEEYKNVKLIKSLSNKYGNQLSKMLNNHIPIIMICKTDLPNGFKVEGNILYLSHVSDAMLNSLYKNALCFVCPSLYEGFGLPIFEAFAQSTPVIALKIPIFEELGGGGIHFCDFNDNDNGNCNGNNTEDNVFKKIEYIYKNEGKTVSSRVEFGLKQVAKFTEESQIAKWDAYFSNLKNTLLNILNPKPFINVIIQSYKETNLERLKEIEYCIIKNLENPYINSVHDFGNGICNDSEIEKSDKYVKVNNLDNKWLTYKMAFEYANDVSNMDFGNYWCIINLDIFLDKNSKWDMIKGKLNDGYIYAQSRHEFKILKDKNNSTDAKMDENFAKMMHSHTQDAWLFKTPVNMNINMNPEVDFDFELGFLGCDNAIAERLYKIGYKLINQPITYKIFHYDNAKGKTSSNFMEKHSNESKKLEAKKEKPKNKYPERIGSYLVPNYDQMLGKGQDIDFISIMNGLGGCSNLERYEFISKLMSDRIVMNNP